MPGRPIAQGLKAQRRYNSQRMPANGTGRLSGNVRIDGEYRMVSGLTDGGLITAAHRSHLTSTAPVVLSVAYEVKLADDPKALHANSAIQKFSWECGDKPPLRAQPYSSHR
jgi:hypothetical protein